VDGWDFRRNVLTEEIAPLGAVVAWVVVQWCDWRILQRVFFCHVD
jgi:hypothetical protein